MTKVNRAIKGFGGARTYDVYRGTIVWKWANNLGQIFRFVIPNSYYVQQGGIKLLSPQHWAKTQVGKSPKRSEGAGEITTANKVTLFWNDKKDFLDVYLSPNDNVATFYLAPGFNKFKLWCQECKIDYDEETTNPVTIESSQIVSDDEGEDEDCDVKMTTNHSTYQKPYLWSKVTGLPISPSQAQEEAKTLNKKSTQTSADFSINGPQELPPPVTIEEEEEKQPTSAAAELLRYHQRFGHVSFAKLKNMAKQGIIPRRLAEAATPTCAACMFAKATRKQWRNKRRKYWTKENHAEGPGDVVSVDQLVSPTPGLIAQMTGKLTRKRYKYATVFVDQFSGLSYVHLQQSADAEETVSAKVSFEQFARQHGVKIKAYHCDNGVFRANRWIDECIKNNQRLTFAGVNAHHTNGLAERRIRSLQDLSRSMLIHMDRRWKMPGIVNLWPYALRCANEAINEAPNLKDPKGRSPLQLFAGTEVNTNPKHWMPFGCPVYPLDESLQQADKRIHHKWQYRSRVGIYLGHSPLHSHNVALVLDRTTGLVSPQLDVAFDPGFHTVLHDKYKTL